MRCKACNKLLTDFETTRKYSDGSYVDMCNHCFKSSDYSGIVIERGDLNTDELYEDVSTSED